MKKISIEDFCEDIVGKAMRGLQMPDDAVAASVGVSVAAVQALRRGEGDNATARAVAPSLGLDPDKLAEAFHARWYPQSHDMDGLFMVNTPYHDMFVNAYLIWDSDSRCGALFDTGADARGLIEKAKELDVEVTHIFLTHTHGDHIMDLDCVQAAFPSATVHVGEREPLSGVLPVRHGDTFAVGGLTVSARLTWGHAKGGITYVVDGLAAPVAVVGDAVFAGSMGGGMISYADALRTNREEILSLSDETVLCPGHGPLTSVGEEKAHNPFF
ncbi:MAG: hydroxyacylglutathione hydrolase [Verrucomicrobiales bacterium]|jgi:hydroxyacylglutathione hydrolase